MQPNLSLSIPTVSSVLSRPANKRRRPPSQRPGVPPVVPIAAEKAARESVPTELRVVGTVDGFGDRPGAIPGGRPPARVAYRGPERRQGRPAVPDRSAPLRGSHPAGRRRCQPRPRTDQSDGTLARRCRTVPLSESTARASAESPSRVVSKSQSDQPDQRRCSARRIGKARRGFNRQRQGSAGKRPVRRSAAKLT